MGATTLAKKADPRISGYGIVEFRKLQAMGTWTTHLNDFRVPKPYTSARIEAFAEQLLNEIKLLLLFHAPKLVIPGTDFINNPAFQFLFNGELNGHRKPNVLRALAQRRIIVAMRDDASSLTNLNKKQVRNRLVPGMYERAKPFAAEFDQFHDGHELDDLVWSLETGADLFQGAVLRFKECDSPLRTEERGLLERTVDRAKEDKKSGGKLLFGIAHRLLKPKQRTPAGSRVIQAFRAAYASGLCTHLGFAPSFALTDIAPDIFVWALSFTVSDALTAQEVRKLFDYLPEEILSRQCLSSLTIDDIISFQQANAEASDYFEAFRTARAAVGTRRDFDASVKYFDALRKYLGRLERDRGLSRKVKLVNWHESLFKKRKSKIDDREKGYIFYAGRVLPVAMGLAFSVWGLSYAAMGTLFGGALGAIGEMSARYRADKQRDKVKFFTEANGTFGGGG